MGCVQVYSVSSMTPNSLVVCSQSDIARRMLRVCLVLCSDSACHRSPVGPIESALYHAQIQHIIEVRLAWLNAADNAIRCGGTHIRGDSALMGLLSISS